MSGPLRRKIGLAKSLISDRLKEEVSNREDVAEFDAKELVEFLHETSEDYERLELQLGNIEKYELQWNEMCCRDPIEESEKAKYVEKYGSYMAVYHEGQTRSHVMMELYVFAFNRLVSLDKNAADELPLPEELTDVKGVEKVSESSNQVKEGSARSQMSKHAATNPVEIGRSTSEVSEDRTPSQEHAVQMQPKTIATFVPVDHPVQDVIQMPQPQLQVVQPSMPILSSGQLLIEPMKLPTFDGDMSRYIEFREGFKSVMSRMAVDDFSKLVYLKSVLTGEPAKLIKGLINVDRNYAIAMSTLEEQYGGKLCHTHLLVKKLKSLNPLSNNSKPAELREFVTNAKMYFTELMTLGCDMDNIGTAEDIQSKLPERILKKIYGGSQRDELYTASELLQVIGKISKSESLVDSICNKSVNGQRNATTMSVQQQHQRHGHQNSGKNFGSQQRHTVSKPCAFCVEERMLHRPKDCRKYPTVEDRKRRATALKLCFRCLKGGHMSKQCNWNCYECKGRHHSAMCYGRENGASQQAVGQGFPQNQNGFAPQSVNNSAPRQFGPSTGQPSEQRAFEAGKQKQPFGNRGHSRGQQRMPYGNRGNGAAQTHFAETYDEETFEENTMYADNAEMDEPEAVIQGIDHEAVNQHLDEVSSETSEERVVEEEEKLLPVIMMATTAPVVYNDNDECLANIMIDSGSTISYITEKFAEKLELVPKSEKTLRLKTFGAKEAQLLPTKCYRVKIKTKKDTVGVNLFAIDHIASNIVTAEVTAEAFKSFMQDKEYPLCRQRKSVDILIGLDTIGAVLGHVNTLKLSNGLQLNITDCGPIVCGAEKVLVDDEMTYSSTVDGSGDDQLCEQLKKFWSLEANGIVDVNPKMKAEEEANEYFDATTTRNPDGRFNVRLPYCDNEPIDDNRQLVYFRFLGTQKRYAKDPAIHQKCADIIREQEELGFIERVEDESILDGDVLQYLAHHHVVKEDSKSTKVRLVYDGSARKSKNDKSLNDHLHTGEKLLPGVAGVMLRLRHRNILVSADIKKAFLQMELNIKDRDATRFLFQFPGSSEIICFRFKRVPFGLKPSPYLLNRVLKTLLELENDERAVQMMRSLYVDNVYVCVNSIDEAIKFYHYSKEVFAKGQMELCQYVSNSAEANKYFNEHEKCKEEDVMQKLLGICWDTKNDTLIFKLPQTLSEILTKRKWLKYIASVYDPLGYLTPTTLSGKQFFRLLNDDQWDQMLTKEQHLQTQKVLKDWSGEPWVIPRKLFDEEQWLNASNVELHVFTDASQEAYGAVAYLRLVNKDQTDSQFLMSKSRIAPRKEHSIPQLEMLGLLCGVLLANYIVKEIDRTFHKIFIWTDSMCTLDTLKGRTSGNKFMKNRVKDIQEKSIGFEFSHVPGKKNPADLLTRGLTFEELKKSDVWLHGPEFLKKTSELPLRRSSVEPVPSVTMLNTSEEEPPIDPNRFGSFHRMLRTVMLIVHFITLGKLTNLQRAARARQIIFRLAQCINGPSDEKIKSLGLKKNASNIWIYSGRVNQRPLVYLPQGQIAKLFVWDVHQTFNHSSPLFTLTQVRSTVWIPHGRSYVKKIIKECLGCRRLRLKPYRHPEFAGFPDMRIKPARPFENCGVDYAGPLKVRIDGVTKDVHFVLFTCLHSRYIYTEVVKDMETTTFLHTLRRLCATFGIPSTIISDNATQFKMMSTVLESLKNQQRRGIISTTSLPEFKFIAAHSPWQGGFYERMIGLLKTSMVRAGTTKILMSFEDFVTLLAECTAIVNCRPLSYVAAEDDITPIRPIDLVYPANNYDGLMDLSLPPDTEGHSSERKNLMESWSQSSTLKDGFERKWNKDYVQMLQERTQFSHQQKSAVEFKPKVGDVVLIERPSIGKSKWPMGRIIEVKSRSAKVKNGSTKRIVEYPWKSLYPLETDTPETPEESTVKDQPPPPPRRSSRLAQIGNQAMLALTMFALFTTTNAETSTTTGMMMKSDDVKPIFTTDMFLNVSYGHVINQLLMIFTVLGVCCIIWIIMSIMNVIGSIAGILVRSLKTVIKLLRCIWKTCRRMINGHQKRLPTQVSIVVLLTIIGSINGCNEIASIKADETVCVQTDKHESCQLNTISLLNIRPNGSVGCFRVRDEKRQLETFVEIQAEAIVSMCQQKTQHFERDYTIEHSWSHRCWRAGSCYQTVCEDLKPESVEIVEFTTESRQSPGYSRCYRSCGCLTCGGCFYCTSSCLFSRLYAKPMSTAIYEILSCPAWKTVLDVNININGNRTKIRMEHGLPYNVPGTNITVIITGFSTPPTPVHGATFIKKWKNGNQKEEFGFAYIPAASPGAPTKGFVGELQCATYEDAKDFKCIFAEELCKCFPQGTSLTCSCNQLKIKELLQKTRLPQKEAGITITTDNGNLVTKLTTTALVAIQVQFKNQTIHRLVSNDTCTVRDVKIQGCFSCGKGGVLTATCQSTINERIEATVKCPTIGVDFLECTNGGQTGTINFQSTETSINENCTIHCGTTIQEFMINGVLEEEAVFNAEAVREKFALFKEYLAEDGILSAIGDKLVSIYDGVVNYLGKWTLAIVTVIVLLLTIQFCFFSGSSAVRRQSSAAPGLLGGLGLGGGSDGGVGGIIGGGQGGVGGLLGSGGILGGLLGDNGLVGGLLGNLLGGDGIESLLEGVLNNGPLSNLLQPLLGQVLKLVETLLQDIQNILSNLSAVLDGLTGILGQDLPLPEQAKAIEELRNKNPLEMDTIFFIASQLAKNQGGNGGSVSPLPVPTPQIPV